MSWFGPTMQVSARMADPGFVRRLMRRIGAAMILVTLLPAATPVTSLDIEVTRLRSQKGMLRVCLTADPDNFPGCIDDHDAVTRSVEADKPAIRIDGLPPGQYALSIIHDENGNSKLDTFAGIPREGFGFSRNPSIGFGPPRFSAARFELSANKDGDQQVRMRYLL